MQRWLTYFPSPDPIPTDEVLIQEFTAQQGDFDLLAKWMATDAAQSQLEKVAIDFVAYSHEGTAGAAQRLEHYRLVLRKLKLQSIQIAQQQTITLTVWVGDALPDDGHCKGYALFSTGKPNPSQVSTSLDSMVEQALSSGQQFYRPIDAHWYVWRGW